MDVFLASAARTPIGAFGGSLKDYRPGELGAHVVRAAVARGGIDPGEIGHVVFGSVLITEPRDAYVSRIAAVEAGIPTETPALTVNRLCGSGLQAIVSAAQAIQLGDCAVAVAGGVEVMSRAPFYAIDNRWGRRMGNSMLIDGLEGGLTDPFNKVLMGVTAENVASRYGITRDDQDALAVESQRRAGAAIAKGYFREQIEPVAIKSRKATIFFEHDEYVRAETSREDLAKLKTVFRPDHGTVTAGNASGINDGAAAVVLASGSAIRRLGLTPMMRLVAYGHAGVDPAYMGIGPVPATRIALERAGLGVADLDIIESNEAFAAQACAVSRELGLDPAVVNPNGSAIALGHPVGATGAIMAIKLAYELRRTGAGYGLTTMCIGGGQGIAVIWERC